MDWKIQLEALENAKEWDSSIMLMEDVIRKNPNDMDAYMFLNFRLMYLLVEEDYDNTKHDYYVGLLKEYFNVSYPMFYNDPYYLYYVGKTAVMSPWYLGITAKDIDNMLDKALLLDVRNPIFQWPHYCIIGCNNPKDVALLAYADQVFDEHSILVRTLRTHGAVGAYILDMMTYWAQKMKSATES